MIERFVYQLNNETFEQTKTRAQSVASATGRNTMAIEKLRIAWGHVSCPRGWYAPDGTYTEYGAS